VIGIVQVTLAIVGTVQRDVITGSGEGEVLAGGKGKDEMTGVGGPDAFLFETPGEFGTSRADIITDFNSAEGDKLVLSRQNFGETNKIGLRVVASRGELRNAALSKKSFIYFQNKGLLYYNENVKSRGFGNGGVFAQLLGGPDISASDIVLV